MAKRFESTSFKDHMRINHFPNSFEVLMTVDNITIRIGIKFLESIFLNL